MWLIGARYPRGTELVFGETLECLQMVLEEGVTPPDPTIEIVPLSDANAAEMVALTNIAFPGFFRSRTCEMGSYYGVRSGGELIAMAGERLMPDGYPEISGVCTHPAHRGKGYAASLIWQLVRNHRRDGKVCWSSEPSRHRALPADGVQGGPQGHAPSDHPIFRGSIY